MSSELRAQLQELAPWHMNVALSDDLRTVDGNRGSRDGDDHPEMPLVNPVELRPLLQALYPEGLAGKTFLDCACNAGGYSLLASDLGASCFGFDVRDHWINQARFLAQFFGKTDDQVRFEVCDLIDVGDHVGNDHFDICLFKGIFYHLPDPVAALERVARRTDEVIVLDTATTKHTADGFLKLHMEGVENPMSGVHGLAWLPTGPVVLARILEWLGFGATCVLYWNQRPDSPRGRVRVVGSAGPVAAHQPDETADDLDPQTPWR